VNTHTHSATSSTTESPACAPSLPWRCFCAAASPSGCTDVSSLDGYAPLLGPPLPTRSATRNCSALLADVPPAVACQHWSPHSESSPRTCRPACHEETASPIVCGMKDFRGVRPQASQDNPKISARNRAQRIKESKNRSSRSFCCEGHSALVVETYFGSRAFPYLEKRAAICGAESWMSVATCNPAKARLIEVGFLARFGCSDGSLLLLGESIHLARSWNTCIAGMLPFLSARTPSPLQTGNPTNARTASQIPQAGLLGKRVLRFQLHGTARLHSHSICCSMRLHFDRVEQLHGSAHQLTYRKILSMLHISREDVRV
jgi:hypothetical protein